MKGTTNNTTYRVKEFGANVNKDLSSKVNNVFAKTGLRLEHQEEHMHEVVLVHGHSRVTSVDVLLQRRHHHLWVIMVGIQCQHTLCTTHLPHPGMPCTIAVGCRGLNPSHCQS